MNALIALVSHLVCFSYVNFRIVVDKQLFVHAAGLSELFEIFS